MMGPHIKGFEYAEVQKCTLDAAGWRGVVGGLANCPLFNTDKCNEWRPCRVPIAVYMTAAMNVSCVERCALCVDMHHTGDTGWMIPLAWTVLPTQLATSENGTWRPHGSESLVGVPTYMYIHTVRTRVPVAMSAATPANEDTAVYR